MSQDKRDRNKANRSSTPEENASKGGKEQKQTEGTAQSSSSEHDRKAAASAEQPAGKTKDQTGQQSQDSTGASERTSDRSTQSASTGASDTSRGQQSSGVQSGPDRQPGKKASAEPKRPVAQGKEKTPSGTPSGQQAGSSGSARSGAASTAASTSSRIPSASATGGAGRSHFRTASGGSGRDQRRSITLVVAVIALIIAIVAAIAVGVLWYRGQQRVADLGSRIGTVEKGLQNSVQKVVKPKLSNMDGRIDDLSGKVDKLGQKESHREQQLTELKQAIKNVQSRTTQLSDQLGGNHERFVEQRISLLLEAANQRLQINHDPQSAARALTLADQAIRRAGDPALHPVRKKIVAEISKLKSLPNPDVEGLSLHLEDLIDRVPKMPLANDIPSSYQPSSKSEAEGGSKGSSHDNGWEIAGVELAKGWQHFLDSAGNALSQMVTIRRADDTEQAPPLMPPKQSYFLTQNLQLQLRTARLALLGGHAETYHNAISQADDWIKQYFDTDDAVVSSALSELDDLSQVKFARQAPGISDSLDTLRRIMRHKRASADAGKKSDAQGKTPSDSGHDDHGGHS